MRELVLFQAFKQDESSQICEQCQAGLNKPLRVSYREKRSVIIIYIFHFICVFAPSSLKRWSRLPSQAVAQSTHDIILKTFLANRTAPKGAGNRPIFKLDLAASTLHCPVYDMRSQYPVTGALAISVFRFRIVSDPGTNSRDQSREHPHGHQHKRRRLRFAQQRGRSGQRGCGHEYDRLQYPAQRGTVRTITLGDSLILTRPVIIDGYTQPGSSPNTLVVGDNAVILIRINGGRTAKKLNVRAGPYGCTG
jgi:hypothetical protein